MCMLESKKNNGNVFRVHESQIGSVRSEQKSHHGELNIAVVGVTVLATHQVIMILLYSKVEYSLLRIVNASNYSGMNAHDKNL